MIVEGQIHGGLAEGVGIALMQQIAFDEQGNCLSGSFMDYLVPSSMECPDWELGETVTPSPHHPLGAKGVGESSNVGSPPAVVNAVVDALEPFGVRHLDMPVTPGPRLGGDAERHDGAAAVSARAAELAAAGVAFVEATVVRCAAPTSARPGDRAMVLGDGTIEGFVGGSCADATVRLQALRALETGEPVLLRILPGEEDGPSDEEGAVVVANPCLSGGALELFLEPHLPAAARRGGRRVAGGAGARGAGRSRSASGRAWARSPSRGTSRRSSRRSGTTTRRRCGAGSRRAASTSGSSPRACGARRCSTRCAPTACPRRRSRGCARRRAWRSARARTPRSRSRSSPSWSRRGARRRCRRRARSSARRAAAVDPVCGMAVVVGPDTPVAGERAFCCEGCREAWLARAA